MKKGTIRPLGENVLIASEKPETKTASGIYLPETAGEKPQQGKVIAIGESDKIKVKVGNQVIYTRYGGTEVDIDGAVYLIITQKELLAVIG
ncbi:MAG: co-chaperone GroES [Candidatus Moraniibacteriota bacterium]